MEDIKQALKDLETVALARYGVGATPWLAGALSSVMTIGETRAEQIRCIRAIIANISHL
jgi:hypothetical protein